MTNTQTLNAGYYLQWSFHFQKKIIMGSNWIRFYVESENPIDSYILDGAGYQDFQNGIQPYSYGGFRGERIHRQSFLVPRGREGDWYFILNNPGPQDSAIHYEVY